MIQNLDLLNERDQLIEVGLVKAQNLEKTAKLYKANAKKTKKKMISKRCCLWTGSISFILIVAAGVLLILHFVLKLF